MNDTAPLLPTAALTRKCYFHTGMLPNQVELQIFVVHNWYSVSVYGNMSLTLTPTQKEMITEEVKTLQIQLTGRYNDH